MYSMIGVICNDNSSDRQEKPVDFPAFDRVLDRLLSAGGTLLTLRDWRGLPFDLRDYWRGIAHGVIDAGGLWHVAKHWRQPRPPEITAMWETWSWLRFLDAESAQLVTMASIRIPGSTSPAI